MSLTATDAIAEFPARHPVHEVETRVLSNEPVNGEYRLMILKAPRRVLDCRPGQFFHLLCPVTASHQPYLRRPMSIYGYYPEREELHFLYKVTGEGTRALAELAQGDSLNVLGPLGQGFTIGEEHRNLLLLARGVGLATLAPLAQEARRLGRNLTAICSARSPEMLMSIDHFRDLGARVITVTDSEGTSGVDNLETLIRAEVAAGRADAFYTCGSNRFLKLVKRLGAEYAIPGQIALEQQMACGLGMCHCCVRSFTIDGAVTHKRVCREGPVFGIGEAMEW